MVKTPSKKKKTAHASHEDKVLIELGKYGPFNNVNCGMGFVGETKRQNGGVFIKNPRPFRGMPKGYPDTVGGVEIEITSDMVGKKVLVFAAIEAKYGTGRLSDEQRKHINAIKEQGGISGVARDPSEVHDIIANYKRN